METVLVTGGSGFIATHCIQQLLTAGWRVRTTVRSPSREAEIRATLKAMGSNGGEALSVVTADLLSDKGWPEAVAGCAYVLHVASPFPAKVPNNENEIIVPARDGALRVLKAARDGGVRRVVLTSSFAAIGYGHPPSSRPFTEEDWTSLDEPGLTAYVKSKTLAERAAWDFMAHEGRTLELAVVNPVGVFGPFASPDYSTSILLVKRLMDGSMPGFPRMSFGIVDVRDVADLHVRAMTNPAAKGQRFLAVAGDFMTIQEIGGVLKTRMPLAAKRVPRRVLPNWLLRFISLFDSSVKQMVPELGKPRNANNEKARRLLGWSPRSREDAIVASAESLLQLGLIR
jgi:nucleoside-diphosphate-sugar epimerase